MNLSKGVDNQRIDKNIAENRAEYEIQVKKLHQMGIYGFWSVSNKHLT